MPLSPHLRPMLPCLATILVWFSRALILFDGNSGAFAGSPPNIVLIMLDNVGQEWFGCYGSEEHCTPNIDRPAADGLRVEHCYAPPVCGPSQSGFRLRAAARRNRVEVVAGEPWKRHTIDNSSRGADGVKLGDINRDGLTDIATGWEEGGEVRVYLNPGADDAKNKWPRVTVGRVKSAEDAVFTDLDNDGQPEVVSCTEGKTNTVYWHRFTGEPNEILQADKWTTHAFPVIASSQMWMQAASFNVDGQQGPDLLLASRNKDATIGWLQAPDRSTDIDQWKYHPLRNAGWVMSLIPHDMDGQGELDLLFTDRKGSRSGVFWMQNPGSQANQQRKAWTEHVIGAQGREVMFADVADVNGDGRQDVIAAVKPVDIMIFLQQPNGDWQPQTLSLPPENLGDAKAVKAADLNGDGLTDLVFTCENAKGSREGIVWLQQQRDAAWQLHSLGGPDGVKFDIVQVLDLDADGDLDILTCEERDQLGVVWYENSIREQ